MSATLENQTVPVSTGVPGLDYEIALSGASVTELARSIYQSAERLGVPLQGLLPPMVMPLGDIVDRQLTRAWTIQFRGLTKAMQARLPSLLDMLARVEYSVGEFQNAQRDFMALALLGEDQEMQAMARFHAFRSAIERPNFPDASVELRYAASLSPRQFSPVQLDRFDPEQLVYSDVIGHTIRCTTRNTLQREDVFVRTLETHYLDRSLQEVFDDQKKLATINHRAILPVRGTGHVTADGKRPFFVTFLYEASTVDQYVQRSGVISSRDFLPLYLSLVEGLQAAHAAGVLHRGIRPEYVLIRRKVSGYSGVLSNFGVPLKRSFYDHPFANPSHLSSTIFGRTLASALDYVAPEQVGKRNEPVSEATDVYSLAKVACLALFATPHPALNHWRLAGEGIAGILHDCLHEDPAKRLTISQLKDRLTALMDPEQLKKAIPGNVDPKMAALLATYQPPPGVGMTAVPVVPAGMAVRRRLSGREVLWNWRLQILKWGSVIILVGMVLAVVAAVFWNPGAPSVNRKGPVIASGQLLLLDKPVANAKIKLINENNEAGVRPWAETDSEGRFTFTTAQPGDGAPPGRYKVIIVKEPTLDRTRLIPNVAESDPNFRIYLSSPHLMDTDVHRAYSNEREPKLRLVIDPEGNTDIKLVINYLGT